MKLNEVLRAAALMTALGASSAPAEPVYQGSLLEYRGVERPRDSVNKCLLVIHFESVRQNDERYQNLHLLTIDQAIRDASRMKNISNAQRLATLSELSYGKEKLVNATLRIPGCYIGLYMGRGLPGLRRS